jgi:hypothetical protein
VSRRGNFEESWNSPEVRINIPVNVLIMNLASPERDQNTFSDNQP